jgi:hypothetical protein
MGQIVLPQVLGRSILLPSSALVVRDKASRTPGPGAAPEHAEPVRSSRR